MPFITNADRTRVSIPTHIMKNWSFRAVVDTDTETVGGFCLNLRAKEDAPIRGVKFTVPETWDGKQHHSVTDEMLDSVAYPYHSLTLGYISKRTFKKKPGETFTYREVLDALHALDEEDRKQTRDVHHVFFEGLSYNSHHKLYAPLWGS